MWGNKVLSVAYLLTLAAVFIWWYRGGDTAAQDTSSGAINLMPPSTILGVTIYYGGLGLVSLASPELAGALALGLLVMLGLRIFAGFGPQLPMLPGAPAPAAATTTAGPPGTPGSGGTGGTPGNYIQYA